MNPRDIILAKPQESTFRRPPEKRLIWRRSLSCAGADRAFGSTFRLWRHGILQVAAQQIDSVCTRSIGYQLYYAYGSACQRTVRTRIRPCMSRANKNLIGSPRRGCLIDYLG